jgi:signal transduction histidine kinase/ActR/RegA family two-component response regulator
MAECLGRLADLTQLVEIKTLAGATLPFDQWPMSRALRGERMHNCELRIRRTDTGMERILNYCGKSVRDSAGKQSAFLTVTDITKRKQAEAQLCELNDTLERRVLERTQALAKLDRQKDEFLAMLSHELRNPLAALSSAVLLLHLHKSQEPLLLQGRGIIERQLGHLKHLVDDLLEVSRISTGRVQLRPEQIAISFVVERALETAQPLIAQRRHTVTVSVPPEPLWLHADAARLEQVLVNLLTNAVKYTDLGGRIWLSVGREGDAAVLRVRDSGIGIAPELLPRIFDLFTQAERSLDRSQGGLGIGLCLVQRLVELHGGSVAAHSVLGQGSEFVVRLPLLSAALAPLAPPLPALGAAQPPASGCRVLVVDDNVDAARALARVLEMTGHEVRLAYDGLSALEAALDHRPEVVLLDIGLPGLDGFEVAQQIRQQAALSSIVLVALTGYGQDADRQLSQEAGFDHHLVKPASFSEIEKILLSVSKRVKP